MFSLPSFLRPLITRRLKISSLETFNSVSAVNAWVIQEKDYYIKNGPYTEETHKEFVEKARNEVWPRRWQNYGKMLRIEYGTRKLVVSRKGSPDIIGHFYISRDSLGSPRASYYFSESARGKGYAQEAHAAVIKEINKAGASIMLAEIEKDNHDSRKLLMRNGFQSLGSRKSSGENPILYGSDPRLLVFRHVFELKA